MSAGAGNSASCRRRDKLTCSGLLNFAFSLIRWNPNADGFIFKLKTWCLQQYYLSIYTAWLFLFTFVTSRLFIYILGVKRFHKKLTSKFLTLLLRNNIQFRLSSTGQRTTFSLSRWYKSWQRRINFVRTKAFNSFYHFYWPVMNYYFWGIAYFSYKKAEFTLPKQLRVLYSRFK